MKFIDTPREGITGIINPENALLSGKVKTTDLKELTRFQFAFPFDPQKVVNYADKLKNQMDRSFSPEQKADLIFKKFLPNFYTPSRVPEWQATLLFHLTNIGDFTLNIDGETCTANKGRPDLATSEITTDLDTFSGMLRYSILHSANQLERVGYK